MAEGDGLEGDSMPYFEDTVSTTADSEVPESPNATDWSYQMEWLCPETDPLLDTSITWNTPSPDISVCLQKSLLVWLPCGFLWALAPFLIYRLYSSKSLYIPHTLLNIVRTVLAAGLGLFAGADLIYFSTKNNASSADTLDPIIRGLTWLLLVGLIQLMRVRGSRNSAVLWIFWLLYIMCSIPRLYSQVRRELDSTSPSDMTEVISNTLTLTIAIVQWILAFFMDVKPAYSVGEGTFHCLFFKEGVKASSLFV